MLEVHNEAIEAINEGTDTPYYIYDDTGVRAWRLKYVRTDGWRGYYEAQAVKKAGWVKLDSSWVTGNWDDAPEGHASDDVEAGLEALAARKELEGYKVAIVFSPTSNVFSTSYDIFEQKI